MDEQKFDVARALKDHDYYEGLTPEEKALVPRNPAGDIALGDQDLESVAGGVEGTGTGEGSCFCNSSTGSGTGTCLCPRC